MATATPLRSSANSDKLYEHGMELFFGVEMPHREIEGIQLLIKAANAGNVKAMAVLGMAYHDGQVVEKNFVKAAEWFSKAAKRGHLGSRDELATMYLSGEGVEKNVHKAIELYSAAANSSWKRAAGSSTIPSLI